MRFRSMLYQTEMERIKFIIRNYLRTRLYKIEKYTTHLLNRPDVRERLSDKEIEYAQSYQELLEKHYTKSFLGSLPQSQQDVNEKFNNLSSVSVPDDYSAVIIRGKEDEGDIQLESRGEITLSPTYIYMVRYSDVQLLLEEGRVELI
ncbi:DNA replication complex GINS protein SLD5 [Umbelopsis sp. WA50703]